MLKIHWKTPASSSAHSFRTLGLRLSGPFTLVTLSRENMPFTSHTEIWVLVIFNNVLQFSLYSLKSVIRLLEFGIKQVQLVGKVHGVTVSTHRATSSSAYPWWKWHLSTCLLSDHTGIVFLVCLCRFFCCCCCFALLNLFSETVSVPLTPPVAMFLANSCFVFTRYPVFSPEVIHCGWLGSKHQLTN